jgi:Zn-dependent peptidase ImmA (M78 family)
MTDVEVEGRTAAERFRREHRLGVQPLGDLVTIIEHTTGIDVAVLDAGPDEHGLTMRDPDRDAVFNGVARTRHPMRQRSTLAHELGHVLFGDWVAPGDVRTWSEQTPQELRCRAFARHLLVPLEGLRQLLDGHEEATLAMLSTVVQRFLVSPAIAAVTLEQAGYIEPATRQDWNGIYTPQLAARFGWDDQYQALQADSGQRRAPQRLLARAIAGYVEGVLPAQTIATLRGVGLQEAQRHLTEAGIVQVERPVAWADASELPPVEVDLAALDEDLDTSNGDQDSPEGGRSRCATGRSSMRDPR